jgi:putative transposase
MARPLRIEYEGAFYHVTARGNERKEIYKNDRDREKFLEYLASAVERYKAKIHVYCLMSNHYHMLIETPSGNLSQIMRHVNGSYTAYFNAKRDRSGHLFQGRYKAILVDKDAYAGELSRYIHLNPVRAGMTEDPEEYEWSSYRAYIRKSRTRKWLTEEFILGYFGDREQAARKCYQEFINALIGKEYVSPLGEAVGGCILGRRGFVEKIKELYLGETKITRDLPAVREIKSGPSFAEIRESVKVVMGENERDFKKTALFISHRFSGKSLREIGKEYGISESGVSQASSRFGKTMDSDRSLAKKVQKISERLGMSNV